MLFSDALISMLTGCVTMACADPDAWAIQPPPFGDKLLMFRRGCGVSKETGFYYNDKVEELFNRGVNAAKFGVIGCVCEFCLQAGVCVDVACLLCSSSFPAPGGDYQGNTIAPLSRHTTMRW